LGSRADEPGDERERGDNGESNERTRLAREPKAGLTPFRFGAHAARRRCLRSAKSMITGIPSSP